MKKCFSVAACAAMIATVLFAQAEAKELKFGTFFPDRTPFFQKVLLPWVDDFNKQAGGDTTIKVFAGGTLNRDPRKQLDMVKAGIADITIVIPGVHRRKFTEVHLTELPGMTGSARESGLALWEMHKQGRLSGFNDIHLIAFAPKAGNDFHSTKPIKSYADVKGLTARVPGGVGVGTVKILGAKPTFTAFPKLQQAMAGGQVDAALVDWSAVMSARLPQVAKHHYMADLGYPVLLLVMNREVYANLPAKAKTHIDKSGPVLTAKIGGLFDGAARGLTKKFATTKGHTVVIPSEKEKNELLGRLKGQHMGWKKQNGTEKYDAMVKAIEAVRSGS